MKTQIALAMALMTPAAWADSIAVRVSDIEITGGWPGDAPGSLGWGLSAPGEEPIGAYEFLLGGQQTLAHEAPGASVMVSADWDRGLLEATVDVTTPGATFTGGAERHSDMFGEQFTISVGETVTFTARAWADVQTQGGVYGYLSLFVGGVRYPYPGQEILQLQAPFSVGSFQSGATDLLLTYTNTTGFTQYAALAAWMNFEGQVAAIPEPATLAMLSAGLVGLSAAARRRKAAATC